MTYILCVIYPFNFNGTDYKMADEIHDAETVAAILASEHSYRCNKVAA